MSRKNQSLPEHITVPMLLARKGKNPITMVTAYDAPQGRLADASGVDSILLGDSLGMTTLGYDTTLPVTVEDILLHSRAVARGQASRSTGTCPESAPDACEVKRGARHALLVADLPFGSYGASAEEGVRAGMRLLSEGGAQSIKLEGAGPVILETIRRLTDIGVPVMGHLGLTPQSVHRFGGFKVQAKTDAAGEALLADAEALVAAGVWGFVLEMIPAVLAKRVTEAVPVVTIGIGAGGDCDGQVQVFHDLLGLTQGPVFKHTRRYAEVGNVIEQGLSRYVEDVHTRRFPAPENAFYVCLMAINHEKTLKLRC